MKIVKLVILIGFLISSFSCNNDDGTVEISDLAVETYVELVKANQYESSKLPNFTSNDIPALLEYINDKSTVTKFPHSPISSYSTPNPDYQLGILMIWTIESIRLSAFKDDLIFGFPSQHPFVKTKSEPVEWIMNHDDKIYEIVIQSYVNWWNDNKNKEFSSYCNIDPLANTNYCWH